MMLIETRMRAVREEESKDWNERQRRQYTPGIRTVFTRGGLTHTSPLHTLGEAPAEPFTSTCPEWF